MIKFYGLDAEVPDIVFQYRLNDWIEHILKDHEKRLGEIIYVFCNDDMLLEINKKHLGHAYYTDIVTFNLSVDHSVVFAEIYVSIERITENANQFNETFENELFRVMIHGVLHLLGYDDHKSNDKAKMRSKEDHCLSLLAYFRKINRLD